MNGIKSFSSTILIINILTPRYLTKSRYKLAKECSHKLFYTSKKDYYNSKLDDEFLLALAEGGFQVGELAKHYYPNGVNIETLDSEEALNQTTELLQQESVIIYEAAFLFETLFIRADIVIKNGNHLKLIEVKAKSFDPTSDTFFSKKDGSIKGDWSPYLHDVAFQKYVISKAYPQLTISSYLLLADKSSFTSVDGLNQLFFIRKVDGRIQIHLTENITPEILGDKILYQVNVDDAVDYIWNLATNNGSFEEEVKFFASKYFNDERIGPTVNAYCGKCEFKISDDFKGNLHSGFHECWEMNGLTVEELKTPMIFELWDFRKKPEYIKNKKYFLSQLSREDLESKTPSKKISPYLSRIDRQELQIIKSKNKDSSHFINKEGLVGEMEQWKYPLHFIDFETTAVAIPFNKGRRPYEQIAFQFSHHIMMENGKIEHFGEWINIKKGFFPNFEFIRALKKDLENDNGSIFRYAAHENTILNAIHKQLNDSNEPDKYILCNFIETITHSTSTNANTWQGERDMIDLRELVLRYYFNPLTKGSNSIKHVLPAIISSSDFIKKKYCEAIYGSDIKSKNFDKRIWITYTDEGVLINPYKTLPLIHEGIDNELLDEFVIDDATGIADGGAAMMAYAKMQFSQITDQERENIFNALKRYCELDTMAMVMIVEAWKDWCK